MKEWEGQSAFITIIHNGNKLFYSAKQVLSVTDSHITFLDRNNKVFSYKVELVNEIQQLK